MIRSISSSDGIVSGSQGLGPDDRPEVGIQVEDCRQHQRAGSAVDRGVVNLCQLGDASAVLETLDHVELPQRSRPVEVPGDDSTDDVGELLRVAWRWHGVMAHVEVDVEVGILDPVGEVETHGHLDQSSSERGEEIDAFENGLLGRLQTGAAGCARGVVDVQRCDVAKCRRGLHVEEARIEAVELAHG